MTFRKLVLFLHGLSVFTLVACSSGALQKKAGGGEGGAQAGTGGTTQSGTGGQVGTGGTTQGSAGGQGGSGGTIRDTSSPLGTGGSAAVGCTGPLDTVSALWGFACPTNICDVEAMAANCAGLPTNVTRLSIWKRTGVSYALVEFEFSGTHGKGCFYGTGNLMGAAAWDDVPTYCNGASRTIEAGSYDTSWRTSVSPRVCDGSTPTRDAGSPVPSIDAGSPVVPPATCYDLFSSLCRPCCPDSPPDCTGKADGYPGYACTSTVNRYCSCQCYRGRWECGC